MSSTLTPNQQGTVQRARQFHASSGSHGRSDAYNLGEALAHLQLLLDIIDELTGTSRLPLDTVGGDDDEALS